MIAEIRIVLRNLVRTPAFTLVALLTLTLGTGVNTAMFTVVNALLFQPAPYPDSGQLVRIYRTNAQGEGWPHSLPDLRDLGTEGKNFASVTPYQWWSSSLAQPGEPAELLNGVVADVNLFSTLGVHPSLGRGFTEEEAQPGRDNVVVLSDAFWRRKFSADPSIIGRSLRIGGDSVTVVGVMPAKAEYPLFWGSIDVWRPLPSGQDWHEKRDVPWLQAIARLKPDVTRGAAQAEATSISERLAVEFPATNAGKGLRLVPLVGSEVSDVSRRLVWLTLGLAGFVLLIACANLGNLHLARSAGRARDFAIRVALGASRPQLIRKILLENLVIGLVGGMLGLGAAIFATTTLAPRFLDGKAAHAAFAVDWRVLGFALATALAAGLLSGGIPAWLCSRADASSGLTRVSRGATGDRSHHRGRQVLIVSQLAFSVVLLAGSTFFARGLQRYLTQSPGWEVNGLIKGTLTLPDRAYPTEASRHRFHQQLLERVARLPGVEGAALAVSLPLRDYNAPLPFLAEGRDEPPPGEEPLAFHNIVSADYFSLLRIPLLEGRPFAPSEVPANAPHQVIINESIARRYWPDRSAVGQRLIGFDGATRLTWEIIGVARDVAFAGNVGAPGTHFQIYHNMAQNPWGYFTVVARSPQAESLADPLRRVVAELDGDLPLVDVRTTAQTAAAGQHDIAVANRLLSVFTTLGVGLSALGLYGVISGVVVQRSREFGIRLALGAQPRNVIQIVMARGALLAGFGTALGLGLSAVLLPVLAATFPGLPGLDWSALAAAIGALLVVTLFSCWLPARRATKVDPMIALRAE